MNIPSTHTGLLRSLRLAWCAVFFIGSPAFAQSQQRYYQPQQQPYSQPTPAPNYQPPPQGYAYPQQPQPQYENPIQFLPKFGKRLSEVVRRLFYGQDPTGYDSPPQGYGQQRGYSLDSSPYQQAAPNYSQQPSQGYYPPQPGYQQPQQSQAQPRYNYPPQPTSPQQPLAQTKPTAPAPTTPGKSSSSSSNTRTYMPPKVADAPAKTTSKPPTTPAPKQPEPPTPPVTTRRSETTPSEPSTASSGTSGSFLKGRKTAKPGRVISPYPPYKELDITGLESGSLALDPTTQKVFEVP